MRNSMLNVNVAGPVLGRESLVLRAEGLDEVVHDGH